MGSEGGLRELSTSCAGRRVAALRIDGFVPVEEGAFKGHEWAQPSEEHLRTLLRRVSARENRDDARPAH